MYFTSIGARISSLAMAGSSTMATAFSGHVTSANPAISGPVTSANYQVDAMAASGGFQLCFYHAKYGEQAKNCQQPCLVNIKNSRLIRPEQLQIVNGVLRAVPTLICNITKLSTSSNEFARLLQGRPELVTPT